MSSKVYIGFHVKFRLFLSEFNETWILWHSFEEYSYIKFHENPTNGSRVVPCGQTDGQTDGANSRILNFFNALKNTDYQSYGILGWITP